MELLDAFWVHAQVHYVDDSGRATSELAIYKRLRKTLTSLFGRIPVGEFGPIKRKTVQ